MGHATRPSSVRSRWMGGIVAAGLVAASVVLPLGRAVSALDLTPTASTSGPSVLPVPPPGPLAPVLDPIVQVIDELTNLNPGQEPAPPPPEEPAPAPEQRTGPESPPASAAPGSPPQASPGAAPQAPGEAATASRAAPERPAPASTPEAAPVAATPAGPPALVPPRSPAVPRQFRAELAFDRTPVPPAVLRTGPRSTTSLIERLRLLNLSPIVIARVLAPFPVVGPARYGDDFGAVRRGPGLLARSHQGTDVFAERGTPVIASAAGSVSNLVTNDERTGTGLRLTATDGTFFFYAHLDRFAAGLANGTTVAKGQVLGFVGSTGDAAPTEPHLHFEIHPKGGAAVDPVPYLDRWLAEASATAALLAAAPAGSASADGRSFSGVKSRSGAAGGLAAETASGRPAAGGGASLVPAVMARAFEPIAAVGDRLGSNWGGAAILLAMLVLVVWRVGLPRSRYRALESKSH